MREKWRVRRGWIKIHAMIDIKTDQNLDLEVRDESVQDDPMFTSLLDQATENCGKVHPICQIPGDGGYDRVQVFNTMEKQGIKPGAQTRENAATRKARFGIV